MVAQRRDVHDFAVVLGYHDPLGYRFDAEHRAAHVHSERSVPLFNRFCAAWDRYAGSVDEDVNRIKRLQSSIDHPLHIFFLRDIRVDVDRLPKLVGQCLAIPEVRQNDLGSLIDQHASGSLAHTAHGARNNSHFPFETQVHNSLRLP